MHPGQYTVLNSPRPEVFQCAVDELRHHAGLLDLLGTSQSSKIVVHAGGAFGDPSAAVDGFVRAVRSLPSDIRRRLVVENDGRVFGAAEVLDATASAGIPVGFDWLHHRVLDGVQAARFLAEIKARIEKPYFVIG